MSTSHIRAIIIDDEEHASETLKWEIERSAAQVEIIAVFNDPNVALEQIPILKPALLFLDVEMPNMSGFDLLQNCPQKDFGVIFTTAYDQFALKAIKYSAVDYILKPVGKEEIERAVKKFSESQHRKLLDEQLEMLFKNINQKENAFVKIALPTSEGLQFVKPSEIMHCQSDSNYTRVFFTDKTKLLISKTLKEIEELLHGHNFLRIHHSHVVNMDYISKYVRGNGGYVIMEDGTNVTVSRSKKDDLLKLF